jgi:hypothetical protein
MTNNELAINVVEQYMNDVYPNAIYSIRQGNNSIWVSKGMIDMYFIVEDGSIVDIQVD